MCVTLFSMCGRCLVANLFNKYDVPAPRYTSYPTVPYWNDSPSSEEWLGFLNKNFQEDSKTPWAMYVHIPYCESLCTFCGCNTSITRNHDREQPYVERLLKEWSLYKEKVPSITKNPLNHIHYGGGTPTFLSADHLAQLTRGLMENSLVDYEHFEGSIEVDPRRTKKDQLKALRELKFNRISLGVQDFNPETQRLIHRIQPFEMTKRITEESRELGYESVNFDLIYGLPAQTMATVEEMMKLTLQLRPDRIALYSLAIVPWIKPAQKLFKDEDLPHGEEKRKLYELSRQCLLDEGYVEIGMDHFALPEDALSVALKNKTLHRNFMGYADRRTQVMLGLGVSSISETPECFHQNEKKLPVYEKFLDEEQIPTLRGHKLTQEDLFSREQILKFMTLGEIALEQGQAEDLKSFLKEMMADGLVEIDDSAMKMTDLGHPFLRNACMALDQRLRKDSPGKQVFSKSL